MTERGNAICLLHILREYSDENHILPMRDLIGKMSALYGLSPDRRTIYSAIELLCTLGYDISLYEENKKGYYLRSREFELSEIRLLMDAVYAFPYIPAHQTRDLIQKLQGFLSLYERRPYRYLTVVRQERKTPNAEIFLNIELLDEAISARKKVSFLYLDYGPDKKLHPRRSAPYVVSPYGMVCENEHYYLICVKDGFSNTSLYRIDLMRELTLLDIPADRSAALDSVRKVTYAFVGEPELIRLHCDNGVLRHVLDRFGLDVQITDQGDGTFIASFTASPNGVQFWALQYLTTVEVLSPKHLRDAVIRNIQQNKYQEVQP